MENEFHLSEYLRIVSRNKWMILLVTLGCLIFMTIYNEFADPVYEAKSQIIIERNVPTKIVQERQFVGVPVIMSKETFITKIQTITTEPVLIPAAKKLFESGYFRELLNSPALQELKTADPDEFYLRLGRKLKPMVKAQNVKDTNIVDIAVRNTDADFARDAANAVAQAVVDYNKHLKIMEGEEALGFLQTQLDEVKTRLVETETKLFQYRSQARILDAENYQNDFTQSAVSLRSQLATVELDERELQAKVTGLEKILAQHNFTSLNPVINNELLAELNRSMVEAEIDYQELSFKYGDRYPATLEARHKIEVIKVNFEQELRKNLARLKFDLEVLEQRRLELLDQIAKLEEQTISETEKIGDFVIISREAEAAKDYYETLLAAIKEASINVGGAQRAFVFIQTLATQPAAPIKPNKPMNLAFAFIVGLVISIGGAYFQDYMDQTIRTPEDVEKRLRINVLAVLPAVMLDINSKVSSSIYVTRHPKSLFSEGIISLRTNLAVLQLQDKSTVTMVTSSVPREGKSVVAANLAVAFAQDGSQTLLIDCDLRRPVIHKIFQSQNTIGLTQAITQMFNVSLSEIDPKELSFGDIQVLLKLMRWSGTLTLGFDGIKPPLRISYLQGLSYESNLQQWREHHSPEDVRELLEDIHYDFDPALQEEGGITPDVATAREIATTFPRMLKSRYFTQQLLKEYIQPTEFNNLFIMTSGLRPSNPSELLSSEQMKMILQLLRSRFQRIVIDSPPALPLSDVSVLSPYADQTIWVIRSGEVHINLFNSMYQQLIKVNSTIRGVVINGLDLRKERYYSYGYRYKYGYRYRYRYGYGYGYKYHDYGYGYGDYSYYDSDQQPAAKPKLTLLGRLFNKKEEKKDSPPPSSNYY